MLTRQGYVILGTGLALLLSGLASANLFLIAAALVPLSAFLAASLVDTPHAIETDLVLDDDTPNVGQRITVTVKYRIRRGFGPVEFHQPLPDKFALADDGGSNLHVAVKGLREEVGEYTFVMITAVRGTFKLEPVQVEAAHLLGMKAPVHGNVGKELVLDVKPKPAPITRIRGLKGFAKQLFPENDMATAGMRTNDFKDLRVYQPGDAVKIINWKATTRLPGFHLRTAAPLVNEYEVEGKKSVWLFLDAAPYMKVGTTVENAFEYAIQAAHGIAHFYLDRGYKLGAYVYNHGAQEVLYPDIGGKQFLRVTQLLTHLDTGKGGEGLDNAIQVSKRYLVLERPLIVVVTRLGAADESTFKALRAMRAFSGRRGKYLPVLMVTPMVWNLLPSASPYAKDAAEILRRKEKPALDRARRMGARIVEWDPRKQKFEAALLHGGH